MLDEEVEENFQPRTILAQRQNFGCVYDCECGSVHVQLGGVNGRFPSAGIWRS
jgi:hypothetical protein